MADRHEESIVHEQVSDVNYQESPGDSETDRPYMCSSVGTELSLLKVPELMHTVHACSAHCLVGVLTGGAKLSL